MFRVISLNANGIRAAARKGFFEWLNNQDADVVCIQETKAQKHQLTDPMFEPAGYLAYYEDAEKKGYSGVAVYSRHEPKRVIRGYGDPEFDAEGRYLEVQLAGLNVVSLYLPSGSSSEERQAAKYRCMESFTEHLHKIRRRRSQTIICGTGTSRTRTKTFATGNPIRRTPASCPRSVHGSTRCSASTASPTRSERCLRNRTSTRGGRTAVGPGTTTSAGASTTTS